MTLIADSDVATYTHRSFNRLTSTATAIYTYDNNGNMVTKVDVVLPVGNVGSPARMCPMRLHLQSFFTGRAVSLARNLGIAVRDSFRDFVFGFHYFTRALDSGKEKKYN